jgi:predicted transcriptional regulator
MPREPEAKDSSNPIRLQGTLRLSAEGVAKVLGDLEARVMHAVWDLEKPAPARAVHEKVIEEHPVAIHTTITVLNKLVEKGLLCRKKQDEILHYRACLSELEFRKQMSRRAVEGILSLGPQAVAQLPSGRGCDGDARRGGARRARGAPFHPTTTSGAGATRLAALVEALLGSSSAPWCRIRRCRGGSKRSRNCVPCGASRTCAGASSRPHSRDAT